MQLSFTQRYAVLCTAKPCYATLCNAILLHTTAVLRQQRDGSSACYVTLAIETVDSCTIYFFSLYLPLALGHFVIIEAIGVKVKLMLIEW